ncbi:MAG: M1 family metallopeptidase [Bacteroidota bacterium]
MKKIIILCTLCSALYITASAQPLSSKKEFTHQDTLRGSIGPGRSWWNVLRYDIEVSPDFTTRFIKGVNTISFKWLDAAPASGYMQIDLQEPMIIDSIIYQDKSLTFKRDGNAWFIQWPSRDHTPDDKIKIVFHGNPRVAIRPPWDGGWIFTTDNKGRPWMTVACQGLGASIWYPCKDHQSDEPDNGASLSITVPDSLTAVGNGRLIDKQPGKNGFTTWKWEVKNPINNYDIVPYIGKYVNWKEEYKGEKGNLDCSYWVLDYDLEKSKSHFTQVKDMLKCFEHWMGPYPFYEDSYKLVETSHLGMEHQSAVAYGNKFVNGYLGMDISGSGWGKKWDYIIVHESGHEWFGNSITANDDADMWIQEGFTCYSETLFVECQYGKEAADAYTQGLRGDIQNDSPLIGPYGVNEEGSSDMYNKGNNIIHTVRQVINNDSLFRQILLGINKEFYHKTVDSKDIENYISKKSGKDFSKVFDQYLRTIKIPTLEYKTENQKLLYRWTNTVDGFNMPVKLTNDIWLQPTTTWKSIQEKGDLINGLKVDKNFYVLVKKAG